MCTVSRKLSDVEELEKIETEEAVKSIQIDLSDLRKQ